MASLKIDGFDKYIAKIQALSESSNAIIKPAVYEGAKVLHDAIASELQNLPTDDVWRHPSDSYPAPKGIKTAQKQGLINGLGYSSMENKSGFINVRIGFDGYNNLSTKRFPSGEPNALVARELVIGTSRIPRNNFVKNAARKAKASAKATMIAEAEKRLEDKMKG